MQTKTPFFDDLAKLGLGAAGFAQSMGLEAKTFWHSQIESALIEMDLVRRDEYEILLERLNLALSRIDSLEKKLYEAENKPKKAK